MTEHSLPATKITLFLLVLLTTVVPPLSIDIYSASMPHMLHLAGASISTLQFTVSVYMLSFAIGQIISGYFSDRFGRRPAIISAFPVYLIGTLCCIFSPSMTVLMLGRVLQGLGAGTIAMTGPAMMGDCFRGRTLVQISSYYAAFGMMPMVTPFLGGLLQTYFGWQSNFVFLLVIGLASYLIFILVLPETHPITKRKLRPTKVILKAYLEVLGNRHFTLYALCTPLIWSTFVIFSIIAPFVMEDKFGLSADAYGVQTLGIGVGFILGTLTASRLIKRFHARTILYSGLGIMLLVSVLLIILALLDLLTPTSFLITMSVLLLGSGLCFPNCYAKALSAAPEHAGIQGALIGAIILLGAVVITTLISALKLDSLLDMGILYVILISLCLVISLIASSGSPQLSTAD